MSEYLVTSEDLTAVADAIRAKSGGSESLEFPDGFVSEVDGIEKGYTVDEIATHNISGDIVLGDNITTIERGAFYYYPNITSVVGDNVNIIDISSFEGANGLASVSFPDVTQVKDYAFRYCSALTEISFPKVTSIGTHSFSNCRSLKKINLPLVSSITGNGSLYGCSNLNKIELPSLAGTTRTELLREDQTLIYADLGNATEISTNAFSSRLIEALVLRRASAITTLSNVNGIYDNNLHYDRKLGHIYVPRDLLSTYQTATNWATHYTNNPELFRVLEDYTEDGTITGAFDFSKIVVTHIPIYSAQDLEFDGTNYIDTQIKLFDSNIGGNFTIFLDYTTKTASTNTATVISCAENGNTTGFWLANNGRDASSTYLHYKTSTTDNSTLVNPTCASIDTRTKIIIRAINGDV